MAIKGNRVLRGAARVAGLAFLGALAGCVGEPTAGQPVGYAVPPGAPPPPVAYSGVCHAGFYTCTLPVSEPVGTGCSCPGLGAPSYGKVY